MVPLVIDSGAFSAWSKKEEINLDDYIDFCHELYEDFPEAIFVNLDVIGKGKESFDNWQEMKRAGVDALPIYHMSTDIKWLERYLDETNHIGLGALADKAVRAKRQVSLDRMWRDYFVNKDRMPTTKVHGMGVTSFPLIKRYPWHSVDSTSWLQVGQFGFIFIPKRTPDGWDYSTKPLKIGFSTQCSAKKEKFEHYDTLTAHEKKNLLDYLGQFGFKLGSSKWVKGVLKAVKQDDVFKITSYKALGRKRKNKDKVTNGVEVVIEEGVSNYHGRRNELTVEYFNGFMRKIPWPRPFTGKMGGLMGCHANNKPGVEDPNTKHTLLYLSGSAFPIENYIIKNKDRMDHLGILLSYYDLKARGSTWKRLVNLKENHDR